MQRMTRVTILAAGMQIVALAQEKQLNVTPGANLETSFCVAFDKLDAIDWRRFL